MKTIIILSGAAACFLAGCAGGNGGDYEQERSAAVDAARLAYAEAKSEGVEMATGPCLGIVVPDWVADVAHDPRQPVDDEPANQCEAYRSGEAHHFVELDPDGNLIRAE